MGFIFPSSLRCYNGGERETEEEKSVGGGLTDDEVTNLHKLFLFLRLFFFLTSVIDSGGKCRGFVHFLHKLHETALKLVLSSETSFIENLYSTGKLSLRNFV